MLANPSRLADVDEDTIIDRIEEAAAKTPFAVVDLEGTAAKIVLLAVSQADLVVIPMPGLQLDAEQFAAEVIERLWQACSYFQCGSGMMSRANPFGDFDDFAPQGKSKPVPAAAIDEIAQARDFPSRKAQRKAPGADAAETAPSRPRRRRRTTGRNQQINIKATEEAIAEPYRLADKLDLPLGAVLEQALQVLAGVGSGRGRKSTQTI